MVNAVTASTFWSAAHLLSTLPVLARRASPDPEHPPDVDLRHLSTVRRILIDGCGTEHIVLQAGFHAITLRSQGVSVLQAPVNLTFLIHGLPGVATAPRLLRLARSLLDPTLDPRLQDGGPAPWYRKLNEALVALDGYQAGASQREIAAVLYGRSSAEAAWRNGDFSFKQRVHRAVAKGRALSAGGYVALLR
jgi:hypothetical protein